MKVGMRWEQIVIASTDYDAYQSEQRYITAVGGPTDSGSYLLELDAPLTYGHWGDEVPTDTEGVHFVQVTLPSVPLPGLRYYPVWTESLPKPSHKAPCCFPLPPPAVHLCLKVFFHLAR